MNDVHPTGKDTPGRQITFVRDSKGDFSATHHYINKKRKKLDNPITIESARIRIFEAWLSTNKKEFRLDEIGVDSVALYYKIAHSSKIAFGPSKNVRVKIDTFNFCNSLKVNRFLDLRGNNGFRQEFTFIDSLGGRKSIFFDYDHNMQDNLYEYILVYQIFRGKLVEETHSGPYEESRMLYTVLEYLETIECEGYYYQEFLRKYPEKTPQEKRMMTGWDFKEYMTNESSWRRGRN